MKCHDCNEDFERIGAHWSHPSVSCTHPTISNESHEIITGLMMGDGCCSDSGYNPYLQAVMTSKEYLLYLHKQLRKISTGAPYLSMTAKESYDNTSKSISTNNSLDNYSNVYSWRTISHPSLREYREWYNSGNKLWPNNIELTPITLKHWYVCDGYFNNTLSHRYISICLTNEGNNKDKIENMFKDISINISNWVHVESTHGERTSIEFTKETTNKLFEYMGSPLPGFEYKWPDNYSQ